MRCLIHFFENLFGDWEEMCTFAAQHLLYLWIGCAKVTSFYGVAFLIDYFVILHTNHFIKSYPWSVFAF